MNSSTIETIVFDLGGVLIDWNPKYLYRKIFDDEAKIDFFLKNICTPDWNEQQDGGRSLQEATDTLVAEYPEWEPQIRAFYGRWEEMLGGPIDGTVHILEQLKSQQSHRLYALTNWSAETFPVAQERYSFLQDFEGILVSGVEKLKKPDPKIYQLLMDRYQIDGSKALFIDDNLRNVDAANATGLNAIQFKSSEELKATLSEMEIV